MLLPVNWMLKITYYCIDILINLNSNIRLKKMVRMNKKFNYKESPKDFTEEHEVYYSQSFTFVCLRELSFVSFVVLYFHLLTQNIAYG
jgi:hypothetical protein